MNKKPIKLTINKISNTPVIKVENLTFSYNIREDRIFILVNHHNFNNRIDFMVTRKKMLELLNGFDEILINICDNGKLFKKLYHEQEPLTKVTIDKNKLDMKLKQPIQKHAWESNVATEDLKLTQNKKAVLLDILSYSVNGKNINFKFISNDDNTRAISNMDCEMFQKTLSTMMRVIPFVQWGISPHILD